jgi:hypothetical protein
MELESFILAAKLATYAAQGDAASVEPLLADTKQLEYSEDPLLYRDIYVGMLRFVGQEVVYQHLHAVWSMSYAGGLVPDANRDLTKSIYAHLRKALLLVPASLPLRGPAQLEADGLRYTCATSGSMGWFHGTERIFHNDSLVYELRFAGGMLE